MNIGLRIKELREAKGLTLEELSDKIGVSRQQIWNYENGINHPKGDKINKMAQFFNVPVKFLKEGIMENLTNSIDNISYSKEELLKENIRLHNLLEKYLMDGNTAKDQIIELQKKIDALKDKYERKQG